MPPAKLHCGTLSSRSNGRCTLRRFAIDIDGVRVLGRGLTAKGPEGIVFEGVDLRIDPGTLAVVTGPGRTGRTALLLALCGRLRLIAGHLEIDGHLLPSGARRVRKLVQPARLRPGFVLEENHRVSQAVTERRRLQKLTQEDIDEAAELTGLEINEQALVRELPAVERTLLALTLGAADQPAGLVIDDVESGLPIGQRARVWGALHMLRRTGMTVIASSTDPPATPVNVIRLPRIDPRFEPEPADHDQPDQHDDEPDQHGDRPGDQHGDTDVFPTAEDQR